MNTDRQQHLQERREERRSDYIRLEATLNEVSEQLQTFKKRFDEVEEVLISIRSLAKTLQMIERIAVWIAKVGAMIGLAYALYKFALTELIEKLKNS